MKTHVRKWGDSLAIRIPKRFVKLLSLNPGCPLSLEKEGGRLVMQPQQYRLEDMLAQITPQNLHSLLLED